MKARRLLVLVGFVVSGIASSILAGCGGGEDLTDVRVPIPSKQQGMIDLSTPEMTVEPGEERMLCVHDVYDGEDVAIRDMESLQGKYGHHVVVLKTFEPKPPGTIEDCTAREEMGKYQAFIIPFELPTGHGLLLEKGQPYVIQMHYVNASDKPILVRDVLRLKTRPTAEVSTWVAPATTTALDFTVPPGKEEKTLAFDCELDQPGSLLFISGHMHEQGAAIDLEVKAPAGDFEAIYTIDTWRPDFRDAPPITWLKDDPMALEAGAVIRTRCTWKNHLGHELIFPEEMCVGFGYIAGRKKPYDCRDGKIL